MATTLKKDNELIFNLGFSLLMTPADQFGQKKSIKLIQNDFIIFLYSCDYTWLC